MLARPIVFLFYRHDYEDDYCLSILVGYSQVEVSGARNTEERYEMSLMQDEFGLEQQFQPVDTLFCHQGTHPVDITYKLLGNFVLYFVM